MISYSLHRRPAAEHVDGVTTITLSAGKPRAYQNVIAAELRGHVGNPQGHLILDFENVRFIQGLELGTLVILHARMKAAGGRLTIINVQPQIYEVFALTGLNQLIEISQQHSGAELPRGASLTN
jgi:anti-anti-sigma factor